MVREMAMPGETIAAIHAGVQSDISLDDLQPKGQASLAEFAGQVQPLLVLDERLGMVNSDGCIDSYTGLNGSLQLLTPAPTTGNSAVLTPLTTALVLARALQDVDKGAMGKKKSMDTDEPRKGPPPGGAEADALLQLEHRMRVFARITPPDEGSGEMPEHATLFQLDAIRSLWAGSAHLSIAASVWVATATHATLLLVMDALFQTTTELARPLARAQWVHALWLHGALSHANPTPLDMRVESQMKATLMQLSTISGSTLNVNMTDVAATALAAGFRALEAAVSAIVSPSTGGSGRRQLQGSDLADLVQFVNQVQKALQDGLVVSLGEAAASAASGDGNFQDILDGISSSYGSDEAFAEAANSQTVPSVTSPLQTSPSPPPASSISSASASSGSSGGGSRGGGGSSDDDTSGNELVTQLGIEIVIAISIAIGLGLMCLIFVVYKLAVRRRNARTHEYNDLEGAQRRGPADALNKSTSIGSELSPPEASVTVAGPSGAPQPSPPPPKNAPATAVPPLVKPEVPTDPLALFAGARENGSTRVWTAHLDSTSGQYYYEERSSGAIVWDPTCVWTAYLDRTTAAVYYFNETSGHKAWDDPRTDAQSAQGSTVIVLAPPVAGPGPAVEPEAGAGPSHAVPEDGPQATAKDGEASAPEGKRRALPPLQGATQLPPLPPPRQAVDDAASSPEMNRPPKPSILAPEQQAMEQQRRFLLQQQELMNALAKEQQELQRELEERKRALDQREVDAELRGGKSAGGAPTRFSLWTAAWLRIKWSPRKGAAKGTQPQPAAAQRTATAGRYTVPPSKEDQSEGVQATTVLAQAAVSAAERPPPGAEASTNASSRPWYVGDYRGATGSARGQDSEIPRPFLPLFFLPLPYPRTPLRIQKS